MKISETWLREWADPNVSTPELAEQLTMAGLEVDSIESCGTGLDGVVVGRVLTVEPHPDADSLSLCAVDVGARKPLRIVCGATNVREGGRYPAALVGTTLPDGTEIKRRKIRGAVSEGMLCSARELNLGDDADGILELDPDCAEGVTLLDVLGLDDQVIDLDLTPNRADCFCVTGVAREVAAINALDFTDPETAAIEPVLKDTFPIRLVAKEACPRFAGRVIRKLNLRANTPTWMQERLRRSGMRPIHPVVDVTNYVMLELGQPMHAYDLDRLSEGIVARYAEPGEALELLGGQDIELTEDALVIADASGPVGLAGIMGGESTAVSEQTRDIFLESAFFAPSAIAGRARHFGLHSDASLRFERGVDPEQQVRAIERATALLLAVAGGAPGPVQDAISKQHVPARPEVPLRPERLARVLGVEVPAEQVEEILTRLKMDVSSSSSGWRVRPPANRFDINIEEDLIEEVVRLFGYDRVPETPGRATMQLAPATESRLPIARIRTALVDRGYQEAMTYSFVEPGLNERMTGLVDPLELMNPISADQSIMRASLWPGLIQALTTNLNRQHSRVRLFESGIRFIRQDSDILEEEVIAGLAAGGLEPENWEGLGKSADLYDIKADIEALFALTGAANEFSFTAVEHPALRPGRSARLDRSGQEIGWLGELHPGIIADLELQQPPVLFEIRVAPAFAAVPPAYVEISRYPAVRRDIAIVVDQAVPVAKIESAVREVAGPVLRELTIFDVYTGKGIDTGRKSVALGLILQETSRTLTDAEVDGVIDTVTECLADKFKAKIRE
jgi:phenylalanyl-tRNA synthetase beta chain